jgi:predicted heme/steroid binding protein
MKVDYDLSKLIYEFQNDICFYSQRQLLTLCPYVKRYYEKLIAERTEQLIALVGSAVYRQHNNGTMQRQKEFTLEELASYDGAGGRPAYAAVNGIVYDVSREATWGGGTHFGLFAGKDLTPQFMGCHEGMLQILNKLPKVGVLKK